MEPSTARPERADRYQVIVTLDDGGTWEAVVDAPDIGTAPIVLGDRLRVLRESGDPRFQSLICHTETWRIRG